MIAAELLGVHVEVVGDKPKNLGNWLWDFAARPLNEEEKVPDKSRAIYWNHKTDEFLQTQPYGTVPAAFRIYLNPTAYCGLSPVKQGLMGETYGRLAH